MKAGGYTKLAQGLDSFYTANCTSGDTVQLNQGDLSNDLYDRVQIYAMGGLGITNTDNVPAPPCNLQSGQSSIGGPPDQNTSYLHVNPQP